MKSERLYELGLVVPSYNVYYICFHVFFSCVSSVISINCSSLSGFVSAAVGYFKRRTKRDGMIHILILTDTQHTPGSRLDEFDSDKEMLCRNILEKMEICKVPKQLLSDHDYTHNFIIHFDILY